MTLADYVADNYGICRKLQCECNKPGNAWLGRSCPNWLSAAAKNWRELAAIQYAGRAETKS